MRPIATGSRLIAAFLVLGACGLGGCGSEYLDRNDRLAVSAGDAVASNKAAHIVDPWPREGFNTAPRTMGQRAMAPVQRYREGPRQNAPAAPGGIGNSSTTAAAGGMTTQ